MGLQDDIGNGIVAAMKDTVTVFDSILGGAGSDLYAFYQKFAHLGFDGTQSWCIIKPDRTQTLRRVGDDYQIMYGYSAEFSVMPNGDRGLSETQISDGFRAAFGQGGDDLLENHITDSGSKLLTGGDGSAAWTDEAITPVRRQEGKEIAIYLIEVTVWRGP